MFEFMNITLAVLARNKHLQNTHIIPLTQMTLTSSYRLSGKNTNFWFKSLSIRLGLLENKTGHFVGIY